MEMEVEYFNISRYIIGRIRFRLNRYRFRRADERYAVDVDMRMGWRNFLYFVGNFRYTKKNL